MVGSFAYGKKHTRNAAKNSLYKALFVFVRTLSVSVKTAEKTQEMGRRSFVHIERITAPVRVITLQDVNTFMRKKAFIFSAIALPVSSSVGFSVQTYVDQPPTVPVRAENVIVAPEAPVTVTFDRAVLDEDYREKIMISPQKESQATWNEEFTELTITPESQWALSERYVVALPEGRTEAFTRVAPQLLSFDTLPQPRLVESSPHNGAKDVPLKSAEPLLLAFDNSLAAFDAQFMLRPYVPVRSFYDAETQRVAIVPETDLREDTDYTLNVFARYKNSDSETYTSIGQVKFKTRSAPPELWPEDLRTRLEASQKYIEPKILKGKYIDVNLDSQITTLFENGKRVAVFPASAGRVDTPTPKGEFTIHNKHERALSQMFQVYLPFWMAFTEDGKYGFHDLPIWPEGHPDKPEGGTESEASIGVPNSQGCVRHNAADSEAIYNFAEVGTKVVIY